MRRFSLVWLAVLVATFCGCSGSGQTSGELQRIGSHATLDALCFQWLDPACHIGTSEVKKVALDHPECQPIIDRIGDRCDPKDGGPNG